MKKKFKRLAVLVLIIFLFFIVPNIPNHYKNFLLSLKEVPKGYENYEYLGNISSHPNFDIRIFESQYTGNSFKINDSLNCIYTYHEDRNNHNLTKYSWYKINDLGEIIDSLSVINKLLYEKGNYFVNEKDAYYLTWAIDGDTSQKPFSLIEEGKIIDENKFKLYTDSAAYSCYTHKTDAITNKRFVKTFYFKDGIWNEIRTETRFSVQERCCLTNELDFKELNEIVTLDFFHKEEWHGHSFPNIGFGYHGQTSEHWQGTRFYNLPVNNNTILFKRSALTLYEDNRIRDYPTFTFYENPTKNYLLISRERSGHGSEQFLIKYK